MEDDFPLQPSSLGFHVVRIAGSYLLLLSHLQVPSNWNPPAIPTKMQDPFAPDEGPLRSKDAPFGA